MNDIFLKIKVGDKNSQALKDEYKEWIEASEGGYKHPHVIYMNQMKTKI
tara:strand:- start:414 stop:560 length:147 start_codon:yes stop_codon:yes gene_type:complete